MEEVSNKEGFLAPPYPPYQQPLLTVISHSSVPNASIEYHNRTNIVLEPDHQKNQKEDLEDRLGWNYCAPGIQDDSN